MPFTTNDLDHLETPTGFSIGPSSTLSENFEAGLKRQRIVDSAWGLEVDLRNAYEENLRMVAEATGQVLKPNWGLTAIDTIYAMEAAGLRELGADFYKSTLPKSTTDHYLAEFDKFEEIVAEAAKTNPKIKTFRQIFDAERQRRYEIIRETDGITERQQATSIISHMMGSIAGSFSPERDPYLFGSMFIPLGAGRSLLSKLLMEAALGGSVEAAQQILLVRPKHAALREPQADLLTSILAAAIGSAALRGAFEGSVVAGRFVGRKLAPNREAARIIRDVIDQHINGDEALGLPRLTDAQLREVVAKLKKSEAADEAKIALAKDVIDDTNSPNPPTREGRILTQLEMTESVREFEGLPSDPNLTRAVDIARDKVETRQADIRQDLETQVFNSLPGTVEQVKTKLLAGAPEAERELLARRLTPAFMRTLLKEAKKQGWVTERRVQTQVAAGGKKRARAVSEWTATEKLSERVVEKVAPSAKPISRKALEKLSPLDRERLRGFRATLERLQRGELTTPWKREALIEEGYVDKDGALTKRGAALMEGAAEPGTVLIAPGNEVFKMVDDFVPEERLDEMLEQAAPDVRKALEASLADPVEPTTPIAQVEADIPGVGKVALEIGEPATFDLGGQTIRADLDVPSLTGPTRKSLQVMEEIDDEIALAKAAKECGLP